MNVNNEIHDIATKILEKINKISKGKLTFSERLHHCTLNITINWNSRSIYLNVNSLNLFLYNDFTYCLINKSSLISILARYRNYNFYGKKSDVSDFLLENSGSLNLLKSRKSSLTLEGKTVVFKGKIRKKDSVSLSNIFTIIESLNKEIEVISNGKRNY